MERTTNFRLLCVIVLLVTALPALTGEQHANQGVFIHLSSRLSDKDRACRLQKGAPVKVRGTLGDVYSVEYSYEGVVCSGYVSKDALSEVTEAPDAIEIPEPSHRTTQAMSVRQEPNLGSRALAKLTRHGVGLTILETQGDFVRIRWVSGTAEVRGWVKADAVLESAEYEKVKDKLEAEAVKAKQKAASKSKKSGHTSKTSTTTAAKSKGSVTVSTIQKKVAAAHKKGGGNAIGKYLQSLRGMTVTGSVLINDAGIKEEVRAHKIRGILDKTKSLPKVCVEGTTGFKFKGKKGGFKARIKGRVNSASGSSGYVSVRVTFHSVSGLKAVK